MAYLMMMSVQGCIELKRVLKPTGPPSIFTATQPLATSLKMVMDYRVRQKPVPERNRYLALRSPAVARQKPGSRLESTTTCCSTSAKVQ